MTTLSDIQFALYLCAHFQASPHSSHWVAVQRIFRYLKHTHSSLGFGILLLLHWILLAFLMLILRVVGLIVKALLRLVIFLDLLLVAGSSVAQSTTKAMYLAAASCYSQILWIVHTMRDFGVSFERVPLMCDNTSAISVAKNLVFHKRMRHLERTHNFLRDRVEKGDIEMRYIDTERQLADIFTKPLDASRFANLWGEIGICHPYGLI
jgi:hypothetical protein